MFFSSTGGLRALALLFLVLVTPAALAHAHLKQTFSAAEARVSSPPQEIILRFSEGIEPGFSGVMISDGQQQPVKTGALKRSEKDNAQLVVPLGQRLTTGTYQVDWHVVSVDGHKTKGSYHFSVQ